MLTTEENNGLFNSHIVLIKLSDFSGTPSYFMNTTMRFQYFKHIGNIMEYKTKNPKKQKETEDLVQLCEHEK